MCRHVRTDDELRYEVTAATTATPEPSGRCSPIPCRPRPASLRIAGLPVTAQPGDDAGGDPHQVTAGSVRASATAGPRTSAWSARSCSSVGSAVDDQVVEHGLLRRGKSADNPEVRGMRPPKIMGLGSARVTPVVPNGAGDSQWISGNASSKTVWEYAVP
jgi:hypothetical protein